MLWWEIVCLTPSYGCTYSISCQLAFRSLNRLLFWCKSITRPPKALWSMCWFWFVGQSLTTLRTPWSDQIWRKKAWDSRTLVWFILQFDNGSSRSACLEIILSALCLFSFLFWIKGEVVYNNFPQTFLAKAGCKQQKQLFPHLLKCWSKLFFILEKIITSEVCLNPVKKKQCHILPSFLYPGKIKAHLGKWKLTWVLLVWLCLSWKDYCLLAKPSSAMLMKFGQNFTSETSK